jgi:hypothetical protein
MNNIKKAITGFALILIATNSFAQQKSTTKPWQFHSINNIGLFEGQAGSTFQLQTINGAQYKSWFAGVGLGLDYYRFRTIPLFIDVRKEFGQTKNKLFVYADAGINFYWKRDKDVKQFSVDSKFNNGFYGEAGVGYKLKISHKLALLFSGGYSYKKITEEGSNYYYYPYYLPPGIFYTDPLPVSGNKSKINYNLNRLVIKAGIEF